MKIRRLIALMIIIIMVLSLVGCVSDSKYEGLEKRLENVESVLAEMQKTSQNTDDPNEDNNASNNNLDKNEEESVYTKTTEIGLFYEFNPQTGEPEGDYYQLFLGEDYTTHEKCTRFYYRANGVCGEGVFTEDVFYKLLEKILNQTLEQYENPVDDNGKIHYDIVPCVLYLYGYGYTREEFPKTFFNVGEGMDNVISEFRKLGEAAQN